MEVLVVKNVQTFPLFLELGQVINDVVKVVSGTLTKKTALDCDGNLVISRFVDSFETPPDVVGSD